MEAAPKPRPGDATPENATAPMRFDRRLARGLAACGGFLLAVLWMDLLFDVQVLGGAPSPAALESIRAYYWRATIDAGAMPHLIAIVMLAATLGAIVQARRGTGPRMRRGLRAALIIAPIALAIGMIFPDARELAQTQDAGRQVQLATRICYAHLAAFGAVATFVALQIARR